MLIDVCFSPDALPRAGSLETTLCVVIDVLRASTTMCAMLSQGATRITLAENIAKAREEWVARGDSSILLAGEEGGLRPEGFESGNSPTEILTSHLGGREVLYVTTNGTRMLRSTQNAMFQLVAGFVNIHSAKRWVYRKELSESPPQRLLLCCSGNSSHFSLEDSFFAGLFASRYIANGFGHELTDAAKAAIRIVNSYNSISRDLGTQASHARILRAYGFESDVEFCLSEDRFDIVPVCREGVVTTFE